MMTFNYQLKSLDNTKQLAAVLSALAQPNLVILLNGPLGIGKTQLTKLIGHNLGVSETITSPTFVILNHYLTQYSWQLIHIDAYRLNQKTDFTEYFELMHNNFTIIEWPKHINWDFSVLKTITINLTMDKQIRNLTIVTNNLTSAEDEQFKALK